MLNALIEFFFDLIHFVDAIPTNVALIAVAVAALLIIFGIFALEKERTNNQNGEKHTNTKSFISRLALGVGIFTAFFFQILLSLIVVIPIIILMGIVVKYCIF